ncbi:MAG: histidine--tRNA ligase [Clostridia bacterium]
MINIPKGTKDVSPLDSFKWQYVEQVFRDVTKTFNIKEIRTPTFEHTELFLRGVGDTTDIVNKEMYTFLDKGQRSITLKPEGTAGVGRSYIESGLASEVMPLKMFYIIPCFRYERPQAGRLREFHQFGIELYGSSAPSMDAEAITVAYNIFKKLGISNLKLNINSIGCKKCRKDYNEALKEYYRPHLAEMCETCRERFETNPLRILDCKEDACIAINKNAPSILDMLCDECHDHFENTKSYLQSAGIEYEIDPRIVRGLDYYSKTVFEFVSLNIGSQGTVCGGGRYDGLVEELGGKPTPAVGFALGIERLLLLMDAVNVEIPQLPSTDIYFATMGEKASKLAFKYATLLRGKDVAVEIDHLDRSFKSQFKYANKIKAKFVVSIGEDELEKNVFKIKDMSNSNEVEFAISDFENILNLTKSEILGSLN